MQLTFFCRAGWQDWDVAAEPAIPDRMPLLVDDDLIFGDAGVPRPSVAVNRWLRELPVSGAAAPGTWAVYARALRDWMAFGAVLGIAVFDTREELKRALGAYAAHRANGPVEARFAPSTWNQHISILSVFYQWAVAEGLAGAVPFTYAQALSRYGDQVRLARANLARRRSPVASASPAIAALRASSRPRYPASGVPSGISPASALRNSAAKSASRYLIVTCGFGARRRARFARARRTWSP